MRPGVGEFGYKTFFSNQDYHITNARGKGVEHKLYVQPNNMTKRLDPNLNPRAPSFQRQRDRMLINYEAIKNNTPLDSRFEWANLLPENLSSVDHVGNFQISRYSERTNDFLTRK